MSTFKLSWKPDSTQALPVGQATHDDQSFADNLDKIQAAGAVVANPGVETNGVLDLRQWCAPVDNQLSAEDCVADSTTTALEFVKIRNGLPFVKLSRLFLYYNARLQTQDTDKDAGTYIRLAFATLTSLGTCTEATWPYDLNQVSTRPAWEAYQEAYPHKISSYYRITATGGADLVTQIKQALQAQHPVVFGMIVDQDYMDVGSDGMVAMPKATRINSGGHAQCIVGYDDNKQRWIVKNSWGTGWGDGGYAHVPYTYLDASDANDFWVPYLAGA
jgi:C1A family cysteine protease